MSYQNFIPTVWNEQIDRELERLCVFAEDCNRKYEGKVKDKGESVKILGVGKPTIRSIAKADRNNDIEAAETIEDTSIIMVIDQIRYFNYKVGDIVSKGDELGTVRDYFGNILHSCIAKVDGVVLYQVGSLSVLKDGPMITYGQI